MAIVCGTDLSDASAEAATAAACLAARARLQLHLVHALDPAIAAQRDLAERTQRQLVGQAEQLQKLGADVHVTVRSGTPDEVLVQAATELGASLVVVGAEGQQRASGRRIGVHSERVAQRCGVAVLVVREAAPFLQWSTTHSLKVVLGAEPSFSTDHAVERLNELSALGPLQVTAVRLFWPPNELQRLGFGGARSYLEIDPRVTQVLAAEIRDRVPALASAADYKLHVEPHLGNLGERLAAIGEEEHADLIVVGSHDRSVMERIWEGSTSHATLHNAHSAVLCVPSDEARHLRKRRTKNIVVATDFSHLGDAALPHAYAIAEPSAVIHVLHVVAMRGREHTALDFHDIFVLDDLNVPSAARDEAWQHMRQLTSRLSQLSLGPERRVVLHVLESDHPAEAIAQAAERLHADVIVLGTHGRSGLSKAVMGSVTSSVLHLSKRPVLLVRE